MRFSMAASPLLAMGSGDEESQWFLYHGCLWLWFCFGNPEYQVSQTTDTLFLHFSPSQRGQTFVRTVSSGQKAGGGDPDSRLPEIVVILDFRMNAVHMVFILNMIFIENPLLVKTVFFLPFLKVSFASKISL